MKVLVSGGFDPIHDGHINYLEAASHYGKIIVALNTDEWLLSKKGYIFQKWQIRKRILETNVFVWGVIDVNDSDGTVCEAIEKVRPDYFANGGDVIKPNEKEHQCCMKYKVKELFGIGGNKINSSSWLIANLKEQIDEEFIKWCSLIAERNK